MRSGRVERDVKSPPDLEAELRMLASALIQCAVGLAAMRTHSISIRRGIKILLLTVAACVVAMAVRRVAVAAGVTILDPQLAILAL